jgi:hypothetical protein
LKKKVLFFSEIELARSINMGLIRENSLYFPCITGNLVWRRVRSRLLPPPRVFLCMRACVGVSEKPQFSGDFHPYFSLFRN